MPFLIIKVTGRNCRELIPLCKLALTQLVIVCPYKELSSRLISLKQRYCLLWIKLSIPCHTQNIRGQYSFVVLDSHQGLNYKALIETSGKAEPIWSIQNVTSKLKGITKQDLAEKYCFFALSSVALCTKSVITSQGMTRHLELIVGRLLEILCKRRLYNPIQSHEYSVGHFFSLCLFSLLKWLSSKKDIY